MARRRGPSQGGWDISGLSFQPWDSHPLARGDRSCVQAQAEAHSRPLLSVWLPGGVCFVSCEPCAPRAPCPCTPLPPALLRETKAPSFCPNNLRTAASSHLRGWELPAGRPRSSGQEGLEALLSRYLLSTACLP